MWFQNRRTKNRRTVDEGRPVQGEPGHSPSVSSDDSFGDNASQDTGCATTTTTTTATATTTPPTRISPDVSRLGRDVENRRHVTVMTSHVDEDEDEDDVFVGNHGNRASAAAAGGWTDLYRQTLRHGLSPMSSCSAAVTIGQS